MLESSQLQPVLVVFEDAHWMDPTTHQLVKELAARMGAARLMLIITHRPEWSSDLSAQPNVLALTLSGLISRQASQLAVAIAGGQLANSALLQVSERAGGIPLFVEALTKSLMERSESHQQMDMPSTLHGSLTARASKRMLQISTE